MKIESVDQLYQLVLQGRELQVWENMCTGFGAAGTILVVVIWAFVCAGLHVAFSETDTSYRKTGFLFSSIIGLIAMVLTAGDAALWYGSAHYGAKRAALPTDNDLKLVGGYLTGEKVLGSEKFDKLSDAAIMYLEKSAEKEGSHADTTR